MWLIWYKALFNIINKDIELELFPLTNFPHDFFRKVSRMFYSTNWPNLFSNYCFWGTTFLSYKVCANVHFYDYRINAFSLVYMHFASLHEQKGYFSCCEKIPRVIRTTNRYLLFLLLGNTFFWGVEEGVGWVGGIGVLIERSAY